MAAHWGVVETWPEHDTAELHIVPMIDVGDGETEPSAAHALNSECSRGPVQSVNELGVTMWNHHDPDHPGAQTESEFASGKFHTSEPVQ